MAELSFSELPHVRILGRNSSGRQGPVLWHTGSGFTCRFTGSELWLYIDAEFTQIEPWLAVEVNGAWLQRFPLCRGLNNICLFRGMTAGTVKKVRVLKECQAMPDDPTHSVRLLGLRWPDEDAGFLSLPEPKYRLEFIGDSITSGEGLAGAQSETDWLPMFFSAEKHWQPIGLALGAGQTFAAGDAVTDKFQPVFGFRQRQKAGILIRPAQTQQPHAVGGVIRHSLTLLEDPHLLHRAGCHSPEQADIVQSAAEREALQPGAVYLHGQPRFDLCKFSVDIQPKLTAGETACKTAAGMPKDRTLPA